MGALRVAAARGFLGGAYAQTAKRPVSRCAVRGTGHPLSGGGALGALLFAGRFLAPPFFGAYGGVATACLGAPCAGRTHRAC